MKKQDATMYACNCPSNQSSKCERNRQKIKLKKKQKTQNFFANVKVM